MTERELTEMTEDELIELILELEWRKEQVEDQLLQRRRQGFTQSFTCGGNYVTANPAR